MSIYNLALHAEGTLPFYLYIERTKSKNLTNIDCLADLCPAVIDGRPEHTSPRILSFLMHPARPFLAFFLNVTLLQDSLLDGPKRRPFAIMRNERLQKKKKGKTKGRVKETSRTNPDDYGAKLSGQEAQIVA